MKETKCICENAIEIENKLIFPVFWGNSLYMFDKDSGLSYRIGHLTDEDRDQFFRLGKAIAKIEERIVIAPFYDNFTLSIVDLDSNTSEYIDLRNWIDMSKANNHNCMFSNCFSYGKSVFLTGMSCPTLLKINIDTKQVEVVYESEGELKDYFLSRGDIKGNLAIVPIACEQSVLLVNVKETIVRKIVIEDTEGGFTTVRIDHNGRAWILDNINKRLIVLEIDTEDTEIYSFKEIQGSTTDLFENMFFEGDNLYLFPLCAEQVYCFNIVYKTFSVVTELIEITAPGFKEGRRVGRIFTFSTKDDYVYMIEANTGIWYEIYLPDLSYSTYIVKNSVDDRLKLYGNCRMEEEASDLAVYVKLIMESEHSLVNE